MTEIVLHILIDSSGNYVAHDDEAEIDQKFTDTHDAPVHPTRLLTVTLSLPLPSTVQLSATVPADAVPDVPVTMTVQ